jgi:hypothetical protein
MWTTAFHFPMALLTAANSGGVPGWSLLSGFIGALVGAGIGAGAIFAAQASARDSDRRAALSALVVEWEHLSQLEPANMKEPIPMQPGDHEQKYRELAFKPMPKDAYLDVLPFLGTLQPNPRNMLVDLAFSVSAYNASATFFNEHPEHGETTEVIGKVTVLAGVAIDKAKVAMEATRRCETRLNDWVPIQPTP